MFLFFIVLKILNKYEIVYIYIVYKCMACQRMAYRCMVCLCMVCLCMGVHGDAGGCMWVHVGVCGCMGGMHGGAWGCMGVHVGVVPTPAEFYTLSGEPLTLLIRFFNCLATVKNRPVAESALLRSVATCDASRFILNQVCKKLTACNSIGGKSSRVEAWA